MGKRRAEGQIPFPRPEKDLPATAKEIDWCLKFLARQPRLKPNATTLKALRDGTALKKTVHAQWKAFRIRRTAGQVDPDHLEKGVGVDPLPPHAVAEEPPAAAVEQPPAVAEEPPAAPVEPLSPALSLLDYLDMDLDSLDSLGGDIQGVQDYVMGAQQQLEDFGDDLFVDRPELIGGDFPPLPSM